MDRRDVVDLYAFRCAVAVLVHARHHIADLDDAHVARVDTAVGHLVDVAGTLGGDLAVATGWLLSADADPGGQRTVRAIDKLAALTHVDPSAAPALAASVRPHPRAGQQTLFGNDDNPAEASA